jgi:hypothetical protein
MQTSEMIAQLEAEINSMEQIVNKPGNADPALVAKVKASIATLKRIVGELKSGNKP